MTIIPNSGITIWEGRILIENFRTGGGGKIAEDIWNNGTSNKLPDKEHCMRAKALLQIMNATNSLSDLESKAHPPDIRVHSLKGDRKGQTAIDISKISGWRIVFNWKNYVFHDVEIVNYHN